LKLKLRNYETKNKIKTKQNFMKMVKLVSTRFTNDTLQENREYKAKHMVCCIYGSPQEFSPKILYHDVVFVVEMNNDKNQIEGIGLIRNIPYRDKYYNIYKDGNYNRYIYKSNYFIERDTIVRYNPMLATALDYVLFKEKTHLKRGSGFTTIPEKLIKHRVCEKIDMINDITDLFYMNFGKEVKVTHLDIDTDKDTDTDTDKDINKTSI